MKPAMKLHRRFRSIIKHSTGDYSLIEHGALGRRYDIGHKAVRYVMEHYDLRITILTKFVAAEIMPKRKGGRK